MVVGVWAYDLGGGIGAAVDDAVAGVGYVFFFGDLGEGFIVYELLEEEIEGFILSFNFLLHFLVFCYSF